MFFKYLSSQEYIEKDPVEILSTRITERKLPTVLSFLEIEVLLQSPNVKEKLGLRDKAILELFYSCGLRVSELINLNRYLLQYLPKYLKWTEDSLSSEIALPKIKPESYVWLRNYVKGIP